MYDINTVDDVAVLTLTGEVSFSEMVEIENMIRKLMNSKKFKVVLDFKKVDHLNYKTINALLEGVTKLRSLDGDLKCASMSHYMQNIFRFTGADQILESYTSIYDAILSFNDATEKHRTWH